MPEKRTIRDINIEHRKRPSAGRTTATASPRSTSSSREGAAKVVRKSSTKRTSSSGRRSRSAATHGQRRERRTMWAIFMLVLLIAGIFVATAFSKSSVILIPEQAQVEVDLSLTAAREAGNNELRFDLMTINDEVSETVPATEASQVERKASGQIVIFNENSSSQNLREETRFETPEGLIFKTAKGSGITVPGASGGNPGQLEVTVYADEPGPEYNIGLTDFVIPGWREIDDSRFETQFARSKTEMTGGFIGTERSVDEAEKARVDSALTTALEQRLRISADAQKTDEFLFFDDGIVLSINDTTQGEGNDNSVDLVKSGSLTAILFNKRELSQVIAREAITNYDGESIMITNWNELGFTLSGKEEFTVADTTDIAFSVSGSPHFEWLIDEEVLSEKLAGIHKKAFPDVLREMSGIKRAELSIRPFWKTKISEDVRKIHIELVDSRL